MIPEVFQNTYYLITSTLVVVALYLLKKHFNGGICRIADADLSGKRAVVTGGNGGIGAETTKFLAKNGCSVIIGARNKATAESIIKECRKLNPSASV